MEKKIQVGGSKAIVRIWGRRHVQGSVHVAGVWSSVSRVQASFILSGATLSFDLSYYGGIKPSFGRPNDLNHEGRTTLHGLVDRGDFQ